MATRLIIDGNAVYEIDEDCQECQQRKNCSRGRGVRGRCSSAEKGKTDKKTTECQNE